MGSFHLIAEQAEKDVRTIVEESQQAEPGSEARKIGDLFASFLDTDRIEEAGAAPLADQLARVDAVTDVPGLLRLIGELERDGVSGLLTLFVEPDPGDPTRYVSRDLPGRPVAPRRELLPARELRRDACGLPGAHRAHVRAGRGRRTGGIRRPCLRPRDRARDAPLVARGQPGRREDIQPPHVGRDGRPRRPRPGAVACGCRPGARGRLRRGRRLPAQLHRVSRRPAGRRAPRGLEGVAAVRGRALRRGVPVEEFVAENFAFYGTQLTVCR